MRKASTILLIFIVVILLFTFIGCRNYEENDTEILTTIDCDDYRIFLSGNQKPLDPIFGDLIVP